MSQHVRLSQTFLTWIESISAVKLQFVVNTRVSTLVHKSSPLGLLAPIDKALLVLEILKISELVAPFTPWITSHLVNYWGFVCFEMSSFQGKYVSLQLNHQAVELCQTQTGYNSFPGNLNKVPIVRCTRVHPYRLSARTQQITICFDCPFLPCLLQICVGSPSCICLCLGQSVHLES